ncbi:MAG: MarR family transcriptional regulator [Pseudomonadota bacterium]
MNKYYIPIQDTDEPSIVELLQEAARHAKTKTAQHLAETGTYAGQEKIFTLLAVEGAMAPGQLAARLNVKPPTITKTIIRLEEQGYVKRTASPDDKRQISVSLTEAGGEIVSKIHHATHTAEKEILDGLRKKERRELLAILTNLNQHLLGKGSKKNKKSAKKKKST